MCLSTLLCSGCSSVGVHAKNWPKVTYVVADFVWMLLAFIMIFALKPLADKWGMCKLLSTSESSPSLSSQLISGALGTTASSNEECLGITTVMRMSFTLCVYHLLVLIIILPRLRCSQILHDSCWIGKFITILLLFILAHLIPIGFFYMGWIYIVRFGAIVFMLV